MKNASRFGSLSLALAVGLVTACSGSSSGGAPPTVTLSVTDAASDSLSNFVIGIDAVELESAGAPITLLQDPIGIDFSSLGELSRVLNATDVPAGTYTGVTVTLDFDNASVVLHDKTLDAAVLQSDGVTPLTGTLVLPITFETPLIVTSGNHVIELDVDLNQSVDVDFGTNSAFVEVSMLARVNRPDPKEFAIGGTLLATDLANHSFVVDLDTVTSDPITIGMDSSTVFQIDGVCLTGVAGLSALANLLANPPSERWCQAFGDSSAGTFASNTVEAGTGSYNGGTDIVQGHIIGRTGGPGVDADLIVRGNISDPTHLSPLFNQNYIVNTSFANTKVVRRGSNAQYDTDSLNIGQSVRIFGTQVPGSSPIIVDATGPTHVVRLQPTRIYGVAPSAPASGTLTINLARVDLRDQADFTWTEGGATFPDPANLTLSVGLLGAGQGIGAGGPDPIDALGFFAPVGDTDEDFVASTLFNRANGPSLLLIRDRTNTLGTTPLFTPGQIDLTFAAPGTGQEKAVVDQGFVGQVDVAPTGVTIEPANGLGLGLYTIRDRTLNTVTLYVDFDTFATALETAIGGGATLFNLGAVGPYTSGTHTVASALMGVVLN